MIKKQLGSYDAAGNYVPFTPGPPPAEIASSPYASSMSQFLAQALAQSASSPSPFPPDMQSLPLSSQPQDSSELKSSAPEAAFKHGAGTLFYGGSKAKTPYGVGSKPQAGVSFKKQKRFELVARMENAALPEAQIAVLLGISVGRLRALKQHPDYLNARMRVTLGIIVDQDGDLDQIREQRKDFLRRSLPAALQVIANAVQTPPSNMGEKRFQLAAAQDLLDREGTFAKISRTEVKPVDSFDWEPADAAARRAVDVVKGTLRVTQEAESNRTFAPSEVRRQPDGAGGVEARERIEKIIEITRHFAAGQGPSEFNQQEALRELEQKI